MEKIEYISPEMWVYSLKPGKALLAGSGYGPEGAAGPQVEEDDIHGW